MHCARGNLNCKVKILYIIFCVMYSTYFSDPRAIELEPQRHTCKKSKIEILSRSAYVLFPYVNIRIFFVVIYHRGLCNLLLYSYHPFF